jgi:ABC-type lipoprotein release transport system permease subunit
VITLTSVSFAVLLAIFMQSLQKGIFDNLVKNVVSFYSGYVQIHKSGYWKEQILDNGFVLPDTLKKNIRTTPGIIGVVPRLESFMLVSGSTLTKGCMIVGTDPTEETNLTQLKEKIISGAYLDSNDRSVLLSEGLAKKLKLNPNDTLIIIGQGYQGSMAAGKYPVKGLVHFGSPELNEGLVYMPLSLAQELLSAEQLLTSVALNINNPLQLKTIQNQIAKLTGETFEVMNWEEMMPEISTHIKADGVSLSIFTGFLYLIIGFGIFGTILMMTIERKQEFGMLIAIGMKKVKIANMLIQETIFISLLGVLVGIMISLPAVIYFNFKPLSLGGKVAEMYEKFGFEPVFPAALDAQIFLNQSIIVLVLAAVIGVYPLWYVRSLNPIEAMKR